MNNYKSIDNEMLLKLFNFGLYCEKILCNDKALTSLSHNKSLVNFFKGSKIIYSITNANSIQVTQQENIPNNTFYYTVAKFNRIGSLLNHIRNSIMHGNFDLVEVADEKFLIFRDQSKEKMTMIGKVNLGTFESLVNYFSQSKGW